MFQATAEMEISIYNLVLLLKPCSSHCSLQTNDFNWTQSLLEGNSGFNGLVHLLLTSPDLHRAEPEVGQRDIALEGRGKKKKLRETTDLWSCALFALGYKLSGYTVCPC